MICLFSHRIGTTIVFLPSKDKVMSQVLQKICSRAQVLEIAKRSRLFSPSARERASAWDLIGFTHPLMEMLLAGTFAAFSSLHLSEEMQSVFAKREDCL